MLKGEPRGEFKKPPLGKPFIQGTIKKSSSPVQTARASIFRGFFSFKALVINVIKMLMLNKC